MSSSIIAFLVKKESLHVILFPARNIRGKCGANRRKKYLVYKDRGEREREREEIKTKIIYILVQILNPQFLIF